MVAANLELRGTEMGELLQWKGETKLDTSPDSVLKNCVGVLDYCLIIGYDEDGNLKVFSSSSDMAKAHFIITRFQHKLMAGDYGV